MANKKSKGTHQKRMLALPNLIDTKNKALLRVIAPYLKTIKKTQKGFVESSTSTFDKKVSIFLEKKPTDAVQDLTTFLSDYGDLQALLYETALVLQTAVNAAGVSLYMVDSGMDEIYLADGTHVQHRQRVNWKIQEGTVLAAYVAYKKEYIMLEDVLGEERFPSGIGYQDETIKSVLCVPVVTPTNNCIAVIEMYRTETQTPFNRDDLKTTIVVTGWIGAAVYHSWNRKEMQQKQKISEFLLNLIECYLSGSAQFEQIITEIVKFTRTTLNSESGIFYFIDIDSDDMLADVFQEGIDESEVFLKKSIQIKMRRDRSVAGLAVRNKTLINIQNAYEDPRFDIKVDEVNGFITRSVLCTPIISGETILGAIEVINKKHGICFAKCDEDLLKDFEIFCGILLHYATLQRRKRKADLLIESHEAILRRQIRPCIHDLETYKNYESYDILPDINTFQWYISPDAHHEMPWIAHYMISQIGGKQNFFQDTLMEFILSVRKIYQDIAYHNFEHAFNVTHCMYMIVSTNIDKFNLIERRALIVACICHDLDHGGFTNNFLQVTNNYLAQLYELSPLEEHHFATAQLILSRYHIFRHLPEDKFKQILKEMKVAILATDLSNYFRFRARLSTIVAGNELDWTNNAHRNLVKCIMMTSCDLSLLCKPYAIAKIITENLYQEYYAQGDIEKELGLIPLSLMDREKTDKVPEDQVQFISVVVLPCAELLRNCLPNTGDYYTHTLMLKQTWQELIELRGQKSWRQDDSIPKSRKVFSLDSN